MFCIAKSKYIISICDPIFGLYSPVRQIKIKWTRITLKNKKGIKVLNPYIYSIGFLSPNNSCQVTNNSISSNSYFTCFVSNIVFLGHAFIHVIDKLLYDFIWILNFLLFKLNSFTDLK